MAKQPPVRYHDESPYEAGFSTGYYHPAHLPEPQVPDSLSGERARKRWRLGLKAGIEAATRRDRITIEKAIQEERYWRNRRDGLEPPRG